MKKLAIYPIALLLLVCSCKEDKKASEQLTMGNLTISKEQPKPGDDIELTYNSDKEVEAFYTYMVGNKNYPVDLDFTAADGEMKSSINIPDSAIALVFVLKTDETYDSNDQKGYLLPLYTSEGKEQPGSKSAIAQYKSFYGEQYDIKAEENELVDAMEADLKAYPELESDWKMPYLGNKYRANKTDGEPLVNEYLENLTKKTDKSDADYAAMMQLYAMKQQPEKQDSILKIAVEKFPNGVSAERDLVNKFSKEKELSNKAELLNNFAENHKEMGNMGNYMAGSLAGQYFEENDVDNFEKYSSMIDDKSRRASSLNNIAWNLAEKGENLENAGQLSKTSIDLITDLQKNPEDKPDYYTKRQYDKALKSSYSMYADTYAFILFKQGNVSEAVKYQEKAHDPEAKDAEANTRYVMYLMEDEQYETAMTKAETFIKGGHGTDALKADYKKAYQKVNPEAKDFDEKLAALDKAAYENQVAEIKKSMIDEDAPKFTIKDTNGKDISLESLKGKTVILDFWATWCGPCKASFPAMQEVVTKYKDDENVVLLFVDTFERGDNREKMVTDFISENKYDFHVVYDPMIEDSNNFEVAKKYNISGIPTKVIIGPDNRMKFKSVGFGGSNQALVSEMDIMIDLLKS